MKRTMKWIPLTKDSLEELKKHEAVLVFINHDEYPYDIVMYGKANPGIGIDAEYWHSYLHINSNQYNYSTEDLLYTFTHYFPLIRAVQLAD